MSVLTYPEAAVIGALQGFSELFPISSLGHSVLMPALIGGSWARDLDVSAPESPYLAFIVGLHVATAAGADHVLLARLGAHRARAVDLDPRPRVDDPDQRLAWLLILATIPVGSPVCCSSTPSVPRSSKPTRPRVFLALNGVILLWGRALRRRSLADERDRDRSGRSARGRSQRHDRGARRADISVHSDRPSRRCPSAGPCSSASAQIAALCPGISRSGVTMVDRAAVVGSRTRTPRDSRSCSPRR